MSIALMRLVARITDEDGRLAIGRVEVDAARVKAGMNVPMPEAAIREGAHLRADVAPLPARGRSPAEWLWWQPAVTVVATTLPTPDKKKNALRRKASAILSIRVAPGQRPEALQALISAELLRDAPGGVHVTVVPRGSNSESWLYEPKGAAFDAADRAYQASWGHPLVRVGIGGSIPFVALFGRRFSELPLILNGVIDPLTTAHGPNESLDLRVFRKAVAANVHLFAELGALGKAGLAR